VGLYGVKWFGSVYLEGDAEYAHFNNDTNRFIDWVLDERAWGSFCSEALSGHAEAGWQQCFGATNVTPVRWPPSCQSLERWLHRAQPWN
jgi:uncharacterized protein with beta-barrel porin domain